MRDLIQALGRIQRLYVLSIGGPSEARYRFQIQRGIQQLSSDPGLFRILGLPFNELKTDDLAEDAMIIGMRLLSLYQKYRDESERKEVTFDFDELENIYYAASAFICTSQEWKKPSILN